MVILKRTYGFLLAGAAPAAVIGLSAAPAFAATTWTVSPGGAVMAKSGTTTLKDTTNGNFQTCKSSSTSATLKTGSGLQGTGLGSITALSFKTCTGPLGVTFTVTSNDLPWHLNAVSYDSSTGVTTGTITHIDATLSGPSCSADVDGTSADSHTGKVKVHYTNSTGKLKVLTTGGNLHFYDVIGCGFLGGINNGDAFTFNPTYTVTPKQTITGSLARASQPGRAHRTARIRGERWPSVPP